MGEKSNGAGNGRFDFIITAKTIASVSGILALVIVILATFYTVLNPQGAIEIIEKLADITQTPFPTYTPQPTILITEVYEVTREATIEVTREVTSEVTVIVTPSPPTYAECGENILEILEFFGDDAMHRQGPTKLWEENISKGPLTLAMVSGCFMSNEGKKSNPRDIEGGYENKVVFYDLYGHPHIYRLIVGGRSLPQQASSDELIFSQIPISETATGYIVGAMAYDDFEERAQEYYKKLGYRVVRFELYVTDNENGAMSDHYMRIFPNSEIYAQIVEAIKTGIGFPEELPDDFYLWAHGLY